MEHSAFSTSPTGSDGSTAHDLAEAGLSAAASGGRNVLIMLPSAMVGGAERVAYNLATALLAHGDRVTVYTMTRGAGPLWPGLKSRPGFTHFVSHATSEKRGLLDFLRRIPEIGANGPFDLVYTSHVHMNALASLALRLGLIRSRRFVSRESTRIFDRYTGWRRWIYRAAYRCYGAQDRLIFQTAEMREALLREVSLPERIDQITIANPVNLATVDAAIARSALGVADARNFRIVMCGRLIGLKRIALLLTALSQLGQDCQWQLDILGGGPLRQELELEAERLGLGDRVHFHGNVDNPYAYFAQADLGVLCSTIEGFPNVLLEMMASGTKQIISTPCTKAVRQLPHVGILEKATPEALVAMIAKAMDTRPDRSRQYRAHIEQAHSIERFVDTVFG